MSAINDLFAGVAVSDLDVSIDWYTRFFGRLPDHRAGDEILWEIDAHATLLIELNAAHAGSGRITLGVAGLDALLERLASQHIEHETARDLFEWRSPREGPRSGWERDRVRRAAQRRMTEASIEPFAQAHLDGLIALVTAEGWTEYANDVQRTHRALTAPGVTTLVATEGGSVVGAVQVQSDGLIQAHVSMLLIDRHSRGAGIGSRLLREGLERAGGLQLDVRTRTEGYYECLGASRSLGFRLTREDLGLSPDVA